VLGLIQILIRFQSFFFQKKIPFFAFNKAIIDATKEYCVSYKINTAFFEADGAKGWESMQKTFDYLPKDCFSIADAKRGDIGNTSDQYAKAFLKL
jgi:orotidine-5'-phosphate decarboxylase